MMDDQQITSKLQDDLNSKSIDELIFINANPLSYVEESTKSLRDQNEILLNEVNILNEQYMKNRSDCKEIENIIQGVKDQYSIKQNELKGVYQQKQMIDNMFTVESLKSNIKNHVENNLQRPKQKLINDFTSKKITYDEFIKQFKELSMNYHYASMIKDKLNLCK